jgi:hypothetical protein
MIYSSNPTTRNFSKRGRISPLRRGAPVSVAIAETAQSIRFSGPGEVRADGQPGWSWGLKPKQLDGLFPLKIRIA